jgi:hypothetical protein
MSLSRLLAASSAAIVVLTGAVVQTLSQTQHAGEPVQAKALRPVSSFAGIADTQARSFALFEEAGKVLQHPRCVNCHPAGDRPLQGDRMQPHQPLVVRGKDGRGASGLVCATCHASANFDVARVPAPASMVWEGKTLGAICNQLKDRKRNGNRDIAAILKHVATDSLVQWGWNPGAGRTRAPGSNEAFGALLQAWAETGAHCPAP